MEATLLQGIDFKEASVAMAKEKGKATSPGDPTKSPTKKSSPPSVFSIFSVGVCVGALVGFLLGWWYPAPGNVRSDIDSTKAATKETVENIARQARQKTADMLEERARHLRQPLGQTFSPAEVVPEDSIQNESSVPLQ